MTTLTGRHVSMFSGYATVPQVGETGGYAICSDNFV
jgi:hypothetical protein